MTWQQVLEKPLKIPQMTFTWESNSLPVYGFINQQFIYSNTLFTMYSSLQYVYVYNIHGVPVQNEI